MAARICPRTGGLVFVDEEKENEDVLALKTQIAKLGAPKKSLSTDVNIAFDPVPSRLPFEDRLFRVLSVGEECIERKDLELLLKTKEHPICYDGFEPSGRMHIAQGVLKALNVNKLVDAGCIFIFWVADWFALLNNKMGGDLDKIRDVGKYFIEIWRAVGMKMSNVKFLWASDEINARPNEYWLRVMDIARKNNIARIKRCATIMGRKEEDEFQVAQALYPCMQCCDIFFLKADICQLGLDQRKVNMLAREYCEDIGRKEKPVILSHHMMMGIKEGALKMAKSDPDSAIFMEDDEKTVKEKIKKAFCPPGVIVENPILDYVKHIIFGWFKELTVKRSAENGGDKTYKDFEDLEKDFADGKLHPGDLKPPVADLLNKILQPVRDHFASDPEAKRILELVRQYRVTK